MAAMTVLFALWANAASARDAGWLGFAFGAGSSVRAPRGPTSHSRRSAGCPRSWPSWPPRRGSLISRCGPPLRAGSRCEQRLAGRRASPRGGRVHAGRMAARPGYTGFPWLAVGYAELLREVRCRWPATHRPAGLSGLARCRAVRGGAGRNHGRPRVGRAAPYHCGPGVIAVTVVIGAALLRVEWTRPEDRPSRSRCCKATCRRRRIRSRLPAAHLRALRRPRPREQGTHRRPARERVSAIRGRDSRFGLPAPE